MDKPLIIPFRVNKFVEALNSFVKDDDYFVTESRQDYMYTVEYIALSTAFGHSDMKVSVYDFNSDARGTKVLVYKIDIEDTGTFFTTKIRMMPGERLNIKAIGSQEPVKVHISGYYELIPQI